MKKFKEKAEAIIKKHGGQPVEDRWRMDTKFGPLTLSVDEDCVYARFDFPRTAHAETGCNPHSGKWNHHYFDPWTEQQALEDIDQQLFSVRMTSEEEFADATGLCPEAVIKTAIQERNLNLTDPLYVPAGKAMDHKTAVEWFVHHATRRVLFLFDTDPPFARMLLAKDGRELLYAFIHHWLDAYLHNPVKYRKERSLF